MLNLAHHRVNEMGWLAAVDGYCERLDPSYWAEPVNALTNVAFLVAALIMWRRSADIPMARFMAAIVGVIGIGSYLFHTHANRLTSVLDTTPILAFILLYVFAASRDFLKLQPWAAAMIAAAFVPYATVTVPLWMMIPGLGSSAGYMTVPVLLFAFAWLLHHRAPGTAMGLVLGAMILLLSLTARTLDMPLCDRIPVGLHFIWHILNAVMLGTMIEVYRRHMLAATGRRG
jgi:hypothetical protein